MRMAEVDLHGHTVDEALRIFIDVYNRHVRSRSKESLRVIHGYGSATEGLDGGRIRLKIRTFLEGAADSLDWKPGEDLEGNPGVTIVSSQNPSDFPEPTRGRHPCLLLNTSNRILEGFERGQCCGSATKLAVCWLFP